MRLNEMEVLDDTAVDAGSAPAARKNDRRGLCRLGEAVQELLANYPIAIEIDEPSQDEYWSSPEMGSHSDDAASLTMIP